MSRVCLIGAGFISRVHAEVLQTLPGTQLTAIVDSNEQAARRLATDFGGKEVFSSIEAALAAGNFDAAHVLVPPSMHHVVALPLIEAGVPTLVEKPLAASVERANLLVERAADRGVALGVNQNFVHHPAFVRLRQALEAGEIGNARVVSCTYHVPLRQLGAGQFGHWMFDAPGNILLEQAVHPLSQIIVLAGAVKDALPFAGPAIEIASGKSVYPTLDVSFACERAPAQLHFAVGESFPVWRVAVVGDDGVLTADILANRFYADRRTRWVESVDRVLSGWRTGGAIIRESSRNFAGDVLSMVRLRRRADPFFLSMQGSIAAFHRAVANRTRPELDGAFGAGLVTACAAIARAAYPKPAPAPAATMHEAAFPDERKPDVAVLGGTGFIGRHLVARLVANGKRVSVMARSIHNLPAMFDDPHVTLHRGDITDEAAVVAAIGEARVVVNLAHGGGSGSWEEICSAMVGGAKTVARVCRDKRVHRLVHIGSIAGLYLGVQAAPVTGSTPPDPQAEKRSDYARAKALCDRMLFDLHAQEGLPIVILRPGLVVGAGTSPFHSGLGVYNNEQHCLGWNAGRNLLPFVLAEDVVAAIVKACEAVGIEGHAFNLVGEVQLDAREYTAALAAALGRPLRFHPQSPSRLWLIERVKWLIKRIGGRRATAPSLRDLRSRGLRAEFDCSDAAKALGWQPVADRSTFLAQAFASIPARR